MNRSWSSSNRFGRLYAANRRAKPRVMRLGSRTRCAFWMAASGALRSRSWRCKPEADVIDEGFAGFGAIVPEPLVGDLFDPLGRGPHVAQPWPVRAVGLAPELVGRLGMPGGNVDAVGDGTDGDFPFGPAGEEHLEQSLAHLRRAIGPRR